MHPDRLRAAVEYLRIPLLGTQSFEARRLPFREQCRDDERQAGEGGAQRPERNQAVQLIDLPEGAEPEGDAVRSHGRDCKGGAGRGHETEAYRPHHDQQNGEQGHGRPAERVGGNG